MLLLTTYYRNKLSLLPSVCVSGMEAVGEVVAVGSDSKMKVGQPVGIMNYGTFAEYMTMPEKMVIPLPSQVLATSSALINISLLL